ncbi:hypothetical protein [Stenotrophomonas maltophilia]|uniref:hypothetical protein n=1 Tax=Stenotrophomonas maltophilia TaxID=40324 RepID=UPI000C15CA34|nr:hypothetical protein [Stenotrophomonas maltophilia]
MADSPVLSDYEILLMNGAVMGRLFALECGVRSLIASHGDAERLQVVWDLLWPSAIRGVGGSEPLIGFDQGFLDQGRRLAEDIASLVTAHRAVS